MKQKKKSTFSFFLNSSDKIQLQKKIIHWFMTHKRDLPWRKNRTGYRVWIAEIMLQQTQVNTVTRYYQRWMKHFSSLKKLAAASEEEVLKHWEGLGYYSRARNIHKTASIIVEKMGGHFPRDHATLLSLPGIGPYTAGAIASLAFGLREPVLDGNVERVLIRLSSCSHPLKHKDTQKFLWQTARDILPPESKDIYSPGTLNEGLIELGALVCTPGYPDCPHCPVSDFCLAYKKGYPETFPRGVKHPKILDKYVTTFCVYSQVGILLHQRTNKGLMAGFWEFPFIEHAHKIDQLKFIQTGKTKFDRIYTFSSEGMWDFKHYYTRYRVNVLVILINAKKTSKFKPADNSPTKTTMPFNPFNVLAWKTKKELMNLPFTSANGIIRKHYFFKDAVF